MRHPPNDVLSGPGRLVTEIAVGQIQDSERKSDRAHGMQACVLGMTAEERKGNAVKAASVNWKRQVVADSAS